MGSDKGFADRKSISLSGKFHMDNDEQEPYWSIEEAARYLGYTPRWLRELAKQGMFHPFKIRKRWFFKKSLIDDYITENNGKATN